MVTNLSEHKEPVIQGSLAELQGEILVRSFGSSWWRALCCEYQQVYTHFHTHCLTTRQKLSAMPANPVSNLSQTPKSLTTQN
jgi:hypothetical protein